MGSSPHHRLLLPLVLVAALVAAAQAVSPTVVASWVSMAYTTTCNNPFVPENNALAGVKMYKGDYYVSVPRWRSGVPVTLAKVVLGAQPMLEPFPSCDWQALDDPSALQYVQSFEIDTKGRMWIIDVGRRNIIDPSTPAVNTVPPKIVIYDMEAKSILRTYTFEESVAAHDNSFLNDIVVDEMNMVAYISDARSGAIIVYDYASNRARRFADKSTQNDPTVSIAVNGIDYTKTFPTPEDGIALSPTLDRVYYNALQGLHLYSLPTNALRDFSIPLSAISALVTDHGVKPAPSDGMTFSDTGMLFFGGLTTNALYKWDPSTPLSSASLVASDKDIMQWPDTFGFDGTGSIVFTTNKLQLFMTQTMPFDSSAEPNFRILSLPVNSKSYLAGQTLPPTETLPTAPAGMPLDHAKGLIQSALNYIIANDTGVASNIVVIDVAGNVKASLRMDGSINLVDEFAIQKAKTYVLLTIENSQNFGPYFNPGSPLFHADEVLGCTNIGGAASVYIDNVLVGAIGVSGAPTAQQDTNAALHAVNNYVPTTQIVVPGAPPRLADTITRLAAAEAKATAIKTRQSVAVMDDLGRVTGFVRMDGAPLISIHFSRKKALSAILSGMNSSGSLGPLLQPSGSSFTADYSNNMDIIGLTGGSLIRNGNTVVAAIGLSGSHDPNVDQAVADAAIAAVSPSALTPTLSITLQQAYGVAQAAVNAADKMGTLATVCVVDALGETKFLYSPEGMAPGSVDDACKKAYSAATLPLPTSYLPGLFRPSASTYYNIANGAKGLVGYSGFQPLSTKEGAVIGGLGVYSEGGITADNTISAAGGAALGSTLTPASFKVPTAKAKGTGYAGAFTETAALHKACLSALAGTQNSACAARDGMGVLRVHIVEDNAARASIDLSRRTSHCAFQFPTASGTNQKALDPTTGSLVTAQNAESPRTVAVPSAYPLIDSRNHMVGSLGVSSGLGSEAVDDASAHAAAEEFAKVFKPSPNAAFASKASSSSSTVSTSAAIVLGVLLGMGLVFAAIVVMRRRQQNAISSTAGAGGYLEDSLLSN